MSSFYSLFELSNKVDSKKKTSSTALETYIKENESIIVDELLENEEYMSSVNNGLRYFIEMRKLIKDLGKQKVENTDIEMLKPLYESYRNSLIYSIYARGVNKKSIEEFENLIKKIDDKYFKLNLNKKTYTIVVTEEQKSEK